MVQYFKNINRQTLEIDQPDAANWINVGETKGRGKLGPSRKISVPIKDIWIYPLNKKFRVLLKN